MFSSYAASSSITTGKVDVDAEVVIVVCRFRRRRLVEDKEMCKLSNIVDFCIMAIQMRSIRIPHRTIHHNSALHPLHSRVCASWSCPHIAKRPSTYRTCCASTTPASRQPLTIIVAASFSATNHSTSTRTLSNGERQR